MPNAVPSAPTILSPSAGSVWNAMHTIAWGASTDPTNTLVTDTTGGYNADQLISSTFPMGQIVKMPTSGYITKVRMRIYDPNKPVTMRIVNDQGGYGGSTIYQQASITSDASGVLTWNLASPLKVTEGQKFGFEVYRPQGDTGVQGRGINYYPDGNAYWGTNAKTDRDVWVEVTIQEGTAQSALQYHIQLSTDNQGSWKDIVALTGPGAMSYNYDFSNEPQTTQAYIRVRAFDGFGYSAWATSGAFTIKHNTVPILTLTSPANNQTLYEGDTLTIDGSATDTESGNIVNVKYQIDGGTIRPITTAISSGAPIPYSKTLTFKNGKLMDGTTEVTGTLAEGTAHTLKVWAEDDQGGKSAEQTRTFYVVANRPAVITIDAFTPQSGLINNDKITISGNVSDPEGGNINVKYKIGTGSLVDVYDGPAGAFSFDIPMSSLQTGDNNVVIQATDSYGYTTTKTLKVTKTPNITTLTESKVRYKIQPPTGSAQGVVLWIQRDETLDIAAEISMTMNGEQENFVPMTLSNTAPVTDGIVEDEFTFDAGSAKENIVVEIQLTGGIGAIKLISGVLS